MTAPRDFARHGHRPPATGPQLADASPPDIVAGWRDDAPAEALVYAFVDPAPAHASLFARLLHNLMVTFSGGHL